MPVRKKRDETRKILENLKSDERLLARVMTEIQNSPATQHELLSEIYLAYEKMKKTGVMVVGITGPPGSGKSTLLKNLLSLSAKHTKPRDVAALLMDPSSPFSGGAFLGDRFRLDSGLHPEIFVRSLANRGRQGGLCQSARDLVRLLVASGRKLIFVETVGVGQTEVDIMNLADVTLVVVTPDSGDVIQTLKAGVLEIADIFVVNKADLPGCERMAADLESLNQMGADARPVIKTAALKNEGIDELWESLLRLGRRSSSNQKKDLAREISQNVGHMVEEKVLAFLKEKRGKNSLERVLRGKDDPYHLSHEIFKKKLKKV